mmetsp:Transcript_27547/g.68039  ORF Transcript_27547/g.68039 Transcript_27547/m.68039 type:complete len:243 (-) Transcript_27547:702-1430(-)
MPCNNSLPLNPLHDDSSRCRCSLADCGHLGDVLSLAHERERPQNPDARAVVLELLEHVLDVVIDAVPMHVHEEDVLPHLALRRPRLYPRKVDLAQLEGVEHVMEGPHAVRGGQHEHRLVVTRRLRLRLPCAVLPPQNDESGHVGGQVLNGGGLDGDVIQLGREERRDGCDALFGQRRSRKLRCLGRRALSDYFRPHEVALQPPTALRKRLRMAVYTLNSTQLGARQQVVPDLHADLGHNLQL